MIRISSPILSLEPTNAEPFVLLVDDHEPSLSRLQKVVESSGYSCVTSPSAATALVVCDARRPSLVITDLSMPMLDGRGLARWLKARYPSIPILLVTGEVLDGPTLSAFRRTFAAVIPKPIQVESFLRTVDELMPRKARAPRP